MEEYRVSLSQFEGPLDLLLHLIEKAEVNIEDIFVSEITAQYLFRKRSTKRFIETPIYKSITPRRWIIHV